MVYKWVGAFLVIASCGGFGFMLSALHKNEEWMLRQLVAALDDMQCELQYRLTPLPDLCRNAGLHSNGNIRNFFLLLAKELECQLNSDVSICIDHVLTNTDPFPIKTRKHIMQLGNSLGRFDLEGQLQGLDAVRHQCREDILELTRDKTVRLRSYKTLGICAGVALVILFI